MLIVIPVNVSHYVNQVLGVTYVGSETLCQNLYTVRFNSAY